MIGRITSVYGVKGWVKVYSYTDPIDGILGYRNWTLVQDGKRRPVKMTEGRRHGAGIVVQIDGVSDREVARTYCGAEIVVPTADLPDLPAGEFYWHQLEGLVVLTVQGECLGVVHHLMETGSNDVLVVRPSSESIDQRERLLPYLPDQVVREIDLASGKLVVDWDPEF